ncbi:MAG: hypothetical protein ACE5JN_10650 [Candidatus Methylomirabilia bacterium]
MRKWVILAFVFSLPAWPSSLLAETPREKPSISARFETPRDFGYHIGDLLPLILVIEAETGVVIDLESLPHRGEAVGPFEVRSVQTRHTRTDSGSTYRIEFALQTFVPATEAVGVVFPPLELRFALPEDRSVDGGYVFRTVTLLPRVFFLSPTAVGPRVLRPLKASMVAQTGWLFWGSVSLGAAFLAVGVVMVAWDLARWWNQRAREERSQAAERAIRTLKVLRERYLACEEQTPHLFLKVSGVLRRFLTEECGIPARVQTIQQITARFGGHPLEKDLEEVLERCNKIIYDGHDPTPSERGEIIREVTALIGRLEEAGCPTHGGNGETR